jgi:hypothetical protein
MSNNFLQDVIDSYYETKPVLLIGNGLNRITSNNLSWKGVLDNLINLSGNTQISIGNKPLTFLFEEILHSMKDGATRENEQKLKEAVAASIDKALTPNELHKKFMSLSVEHFLTPNYDYCLEKSIDPLFKKMNKEKVKNESKKYSLHRHNKVNNKVIWHMHGELDNALPDETNNYKEKSIMLGFDQYMRTIIEMSELLNEGSYRNLHGKESFEKSFLNLLQSEITDRSWLTFFFTHDIHMVGFDLGIQETHLWWLLHYRNKLAARKKIIYRNKILYYVSPYERLLKKDQLELLQSLGVNITEVQCDFNNGNFYKELYERIYELIAESF